MLQTLFQIPIYLFQWPWLALWILPLVLVALWELRRNSISEVLTTWGVPIVFLILFSYFALPQVADMGIDPADPTQAIPQGLAVRGYGLMMLLGITAGVLLAVYRGKPEGLSFEDVISLTIVLAIAGLIGARLFFVIQYRDRFADLPLGPRLIEMVNLAKGGLVVYGAFIGASLAMIYWCRVKNYRLGKIADLVAPSFLVGLSLGRIGCLLNGCCFGGFCDIPQVAMEFPVGSPPYERQIEEGSILGLESVKASKEDQEKQNLAVFAQAKLKYDFQPWRQVTKVSPNSAAEMLGVQVGDIIYLQPNSIGPPGVTFEKVLRFGKRNSADLPAPLTLHSNRQASTVVDWALLPDQSRAIHPTQIYSSVMAAILAVVVLLSYRYRRFDGQSFLLMAMLYSIIRFLLELVRVDEEGQFGTPFSISQLVAMALFVLAALLMGYAFYTKAAKLPVGKLRAEAPEIA